MFPVAGRLLGPGDEMECRQQNATCVMQLREVPAIAATGGCVK
jgi:hypothetical protein